MMLNRLVSLAALGLALTLPAAAQAQRDTTRMGRAKQGSSATQAHSGRSAMRMPSKATAKCTDGTWSTAANQQGACSSHGGVGTWFGTKPSDATARCTDGSYYENEQMQGACSGHGGVAIRYHKAKSAGSGAKGGAKSKTS